MVKLSREEQKRQASEALELQRGLRDYAQRAQSVLARIAESTPYNDRSTPRNS